MPSGEVTEVGGNPERSLPDVSNLVAKTLVREWARRYRKELECDWEFARSQEPLMPIPPLE